MAATHDAHPPVEAVEAWLATFTAANTQVAYRRDLAVFFAWCEGHGLSPADVTHAEGAVERFQEELATLGSAATARRRSSAVHGFVQWFCRNRVPGGPGHRPIPAEPDSTTVALSPDHRDQVLHALGPQVSKAQVLVTLLLLDGLKLDEVLKLDVGDVSGRLPRFDVEVTRDQRPQRLSLHPTTSQAVSDHLGELGAGDQDGPLLLGRGGNGRLTRFGADYLVKRVGRAACLEAPLTSNVLRRTYVGNAHASGETLEDIRYRVGHNDVRTTRRYLPDGDPGR